MAMDLMDGPLLRTLTGHDSTVNCVVVTADGCYAISASSDNTLKVWELGTWKEIATFQEHDGSVYSVTVTPDSRYVISGSSDRTLKVWDLKA
jgi:WD40 repeat protein